MHRPIGPLLDDAPPVIKTLIKAALGMLLFGAILVGLLAIASKVATPTEPAPSISKAWAEGVIPQ